VLLTSAKIDWNSKISLDAQELPWVYQGGALSCRYSNLKLELIITFGKLEFFLEIPVLIPTDPAQITPMPYIGLKSIGDTGQLLAGCLSGMPSTGWSKY
jgi:hypothetical protein